MSYPSIYISKKSNYIFNEDSFHIIQFKEIKIVYEKSISEDVLMLQNGSYCLFAHCNLLKRKGLITNFKRSPKKILKEFNEHYSEFINDFHWGFIFLLDLNSNLYTLFNDPFGIYPIYHSGVKSDFLIANDFYGLCSRLKEVHFDLNGITDYFLFNYTLKSRTLIKEINQLIGGSQINFSKQGIDVYQVFDISLILETDHKQNTGFIHKNFADNLLGNLNKEFPTELALTGGFDNKVSLSVLLNSKEKFEAFTFGNKNSPDQIAAAEVAKLFSIPHKQLPVDCDFLDNISGHAQEFIRNAGNAPILDSLIYYRMVNQKILRSNLILGHMGGELIVGPVLISELVITENSALVMKSNSKRELVASLRCNLDKIKILKNLMTSNRFEVYIQSLTAYTDFDQSKKNGPLLSFLLQETYPKFFGAVFSNLFKRYNVINPYLDILFLKKLYASRFSFLKKKTFKKSPIGHFFSRRLYPILIKNIHPPVLSSKMDRGYVLSDFLKWYKFYKPVLNYAKRHLIKKKKSPSLTHDINQLLINEFKLKWEKSTLRNQEFIHTKEIDRLLTKHDQTKEITKTEEKNLLKLMVLHYLLEESDLNIVGVL